jgi:hypothetical protein
LSYQQNLLRRTEEDALNFELAGYTGCTLEAMGAWRLAGPHIMDVKLDDVAADFDNTMRAIFSHLGFQKNERELAVRLAASHDIARMDDATVARNPHIHSRQLSKWRDILSPLQVASFKQRYGSLMTRLGYA